MTSENKNVSDSKTETQEGKTAPDASEVAKKPVMTDDKMATDKKSESVTK
jgi:hypothetical protein